MNGSFHKTRIAPTPSGYLHIGNAFSFALTAILAHRTNAGLLLRIDDMDQERANKAFVDDIFETLQFLGIPWTEGPRNRQELEQQYTQLLRMPLYEKALAQLREKDLVYACTCSRAQILQSGSSMYPGTCRHKNIPLDTPDAAWRLRTRADAKIGVKLWNGNRTYSLLPPDMHDVIVRKKDGFPAYQLSSVVDDVFFGIDLIVRGQDLWPSTLIQLYIAELLQEEHFLSTAFHHHSLLMDDGQRKLSKSAGDTSIHYLRQHNYSAGEVYALLGQKLGCGTAIKKWQDLQSFL